MEALEEGPTEPLEKIVMLFAVEREGKRWMNLLCGPGGGKLELNKAVAKTMGSQAGLLGAGGDGAGGGGLQMNEATKRSLAAVFIQQRWKRNRMPFRMADVVQTAIARKAELAEKSSGADGGKPAEGGQSAVEEPEKPMEEEAVAVAVDPNEPPPGLTKMQQVAWKRQQKALQKEKDKEEKGSGGDA